MPLSPLSSSSRKRSYAEFRYSPSRSQSPPPKRRRGIATSPASPLQSSTPRRFAGDGFDYRRPAMAVPNNQQDTIDLTLDDDSPTPPPPSRRPSHSPDFFLPDLSPSPQPSQRTNDIRQRRPTPFRPGDAASRPEVIDLSDESDHPLPAIPPQYLRPTRSSSPDIEFLRERPAPAALRHPEQPAQPLPTSRRDPWHPPQQRAMGLAAGGNFRNLLTYARENAQHMLGGFNLDFILQPQTHQMAAHGGALEIIDPGLDDAGFGEINFNYQQAAFPVGGRQSETPHPQQGRPGTYKAPPPAREGYVRTYEEESILICPYCELELATGGEGEDDVRRQVWINKACGHVYCGDCARNRTTYRNANKRDNRQTKTHKTLPFKTCKVEGCGKAVTNKSGMIQIYL